MIDVIELNDAKFAETKEEFEGGSCVGFARRLKRQIKLFNNDNELIGKINCWGVLCKATKMDDGRHWYNFATIPQIGAYGSYMRSREEIEALAIERTAHPSGDSLYLFK